MLFIADAYAQSAPAPQGGGMGSLIMMIALFAVMYFLMIRPQQKRAKEHKELITNLKKGDEVATASGMMGKIVGLDEYAIDLEIAKNTVIRIQRPFVSVVLPKGTLKQILKSENSLEKSETPKEEKTEEAPASKE